MKAPLVFDRVVELIGVVESRLMGVVESLAHPAALQTVVVSC